MLAAVSLYGFSTVGTTHGCLSLEQPAEDLGTRILQRGRMDGGQTFE